MNCKNCKNKVMRLIHQLIINHAPRANNSVSHSDSLSVLVKLILTAHPVITINLNGVSWKYARAGIWTQIKGLEGLYPTLRLLVLKNKKNYLILSKGTDLKSPFEWWDIRSLHFLSEIFITFTLFFDLLAFSPMYLSLEDIASAIFSFFVNIILFLIMYFNRSFILNTFLRPFPGFFFSSFFSPIYSKDSSI